MWHGRGRYPEYVSVATKRAKAEKKRKVLKKNNPNLKPVIIQGQTIAKTWWGKSWNKNLESYADYSNRIGRGRSYLRHGSVLDLQIKSGEIKALVMGSSTRAYKVEVTIKDLKNEIWDDIKTNCRGSFESLQELLQGNFPKSLEDIFTNRKAGLFPSSEEISFECSCPDWADMCKHVAATLYGIGARLDHDPGLFFVLRNVKMEDLVTETIKEQTTDLIQKAKKKSSRVLKDSNLSEMFGIDMDEDVVLKKPLNSVKIKKKKVVNKKKKISKKRVVKKLTVKKKISKKMIEKKRDMKK